MSQTIHAHVTVKSVTHFMRMNEHYHTPREEGFVCVTMLTPEGGCYVTFTRDDTLFATSVAESDAFLLGGKFKRTQVYEGQESTVLTNCVKGGYAPKKTDVRVAARNRTLGLA